MPKQSVNIKNYQKLCPRIRIIVKKMSLPEGHEFELLGYVIPEGEDQGFFQLFDTIRYSSTSAEYYGTLEELPVLSPMIVKAMASPLEVLPTMLDHDSLIVRHLVKGRLALGF